MQETRVAGRFLQRMAEGVAQIKNTPQTGFALIAADDLHFDFSRTPEDFLQSLCLLRKKTSTPSLPPL